MNYKSSGVDINAGNHAVNLIKPLVKKTHNKNVISNLGSFASFYAMPQGYKNPILVSCTDGVGTKLKIAIEIQIFDTIGLDLVAMNVNDLICCGAKPMFFLDYIACNKLLPEQIKIIISGMVEGCLQSQCALIGGEMAEMNDLYKPGDYDLAGFSVGIVDKDNFIDGSKITPNQNIYGFTSSGLHSNGYSLARKVLTDKALADNNLPKKELLTPTKIYVKSIFDLLEKNILITGIAHITGGGLQENLVRSLPENIVAEIKEENIKIPQIFNIIQKVGNISKTEMFRVFNMGIGMVVISPEKLETSADFIYLGKTKKGKKEVILV